MDVVYFFRMFLLELDPSFRPVFATAHTPFRHFDMRLGHLEQLSTCHIENSFNKQLPPETLTAIVELGDAMFSDLSIVGAVESKRS